MKLLLPLLLIALSGFAQDSPKIDPNTGLPTSESRADDEHQLLLEMLKGCRKELAAAPYVYDTYGKLDKDLKTALETKLKLSFRRNKIIFADDTSKIVKTRNEFSFRYFGVSLKVGRITRSNTTLGYTWTMEIRRQIKAYDGKTDLPSTAWGIFGGTVSNSTELKGAVDTALDKLCLAILEADEKSQIEGAKSLQQKEAEEAFKKHRRLFLDEKLKRPASKPKK